MELVHGLVVLRLEVAHAELDPRGGEELPEAVGDGGPLDALAVLGEEDAPLDEAGGDADEPSVVLDDLGGTRGVARSLDLF